MEHKKHIRLQFIICAVLIVLMLTAAILATLLIRPAQDDPSVPTGDSPAPSAMATVPSSSPEPTSQTDSGLLPEESEGTEPTITPTEPPEQKNVTALGIDVSKYQGVIDWQKVADAGVEFAMIRVGYRTSVGGVITEDPTAAYNIQQALNNGIQVGVYFFSTAISEAEAAEEAAWVWNFIKDYHITYPVAYNCEGFNKSTSRQYELTQSQRSDIALHFLDEIRAYGYTAMFYAAKTELEFEAQWDTTRIEHQYPIWVANYTDPPYPDTPESEYTGEFIMWQYSCTGSVSGISGDVDLNAAYFTVDSDTSGVVGSDEQINWDVLLNFRDTNEEVTAKERTNLRSIPSQGDDSVVLYTLTNGEIARRIAISDYGWSKLEFNGKIYYAVSSYLSTDLTPPEYVIQTQFTQVSELVTAKEVVNLRTLPSVTHEDSEVIGQLVNGQVIERTGVNEELGWSRVVYNGQTLYCISQYLMIAGELEDPTDPEIE